MSSVLSALASTYPASEPPTISFQSINAEDLPDISEAHDVSAVPFVALIRDGQTVDTVSGADAAKLRTTVERHYNANGKSNGAQLPPAQVVTRPAEQPAPKSATTNGEAKDPLRPKNGSAAGGAAKDLSAYAPGKSDPATAPQYSSGKDTTDGEGKKEEPADLHTRLTSLTTAAPVMLFMKGTPSAPQCGFSRQLVSILRENSVRYGFFNILADEEVRQGLKEFADWPTFPQLWMDGELVGGLDIVKEELDGNGAFFEGYSAKAVAA